MTASELLAALADPAVARDVRRVLRLPDEPVAEALRDLAAAQARTDATVRDLAVAQARTDATVDRLAERVDRLAVAQAHTDATVDRLAERVDRLAAAQARTEAAVQALAHESRETRRALGALSDNIGFGLEELAAIVLPAVLERDAGVLVETFVRRFLGPPQDEFELDLYAEGHRDGTPVIVAGEVKSRIRRADVESFARRVRKALPDAGPALVPIMFGFVVHPSARDAATQLGVLVVASRPTA